MGDLSAFEGGRPAGVVVSLLGIALLASLFIQSGCSRTRIGLLRVEPEPVGVWIPEERLRAGFMTFEQVAIAATTDKAKDYLVWEGENVREWGLGRAPIECRIVLVMPLPSQQSMESAGEPPEFKAQGLILTGASTCSWLEATLKREVFPATDRLELHGAFVASRARYLRLIPGPCEWRRPARPGLPDDPGGTAAEGRFNLSLAVPLPSPGTTEEIAQGILQWAGLRLQDGQLRLITTEDP